MPTGIREQRNYAAAAWAATTGGVCAADVSATPSAICRLTMEHAGMRSILKQIGDEAGRLDAAIQLKWTSSTRKQ